MRADSIFSLTKENKHIFPKCQSFLLHLYLISTLWRRESEPGLANAFEDQVEAAVVTHLNVLEWRKCAQNEAQRRPTVCNE